MLVALDRHRCGAEDTPIVGTVTASGSTGAVAWSISQPFPAYGSRTLGTLFAVSGAFVDPATGSLLWTPDRSALGDYPELLVIGEYRGRSIPRFLEPLRGGGVGASDGLWIRLHQLAHRQVRTVTPGY